MRAHPFDRYAPFTDIVALKEWSAKPLRKSVRVNTLKCSVERFREWAKEKGWKLEQVPWCREGFFVERSAAPHPGPLPMGEGDQPHSLSPRERVRVRGDEREALGKDLLHLIGGFYIQEAASMLPVGLLDPQPGEAILDMSAAPGSKATQIAARMIHPLPLEGRGQGEGCARGVILANDIQEHRLWTLKSSLHRSGVTNVIVTKKVGQWFGKHMTERFDRVLCDAPCTAQGTVRKDSDALNYCGQENSEKMARLQVQLLEAAIHAAKVGGRIVYSTCTLTPEENEGVVGTILGKCEGKVEAVDVREGRMKNQELGISLETAMEDSRCVQQFLHPAPYTLLPTLRLWPQTYDTEGFFCAVFQKIAPTRPVEPMWTVPFQEERLSGSRQKEIAAKLEDCYGTDFLGGGDILFKSGEQLFLTNADVASHHLPIQDYSAGIPFAKILNDGRVRVSHEIATLRGTRATKGIAAIHDDRLTFFLKGKDAPCAQELRGDILLLYKDFCIGRALAKNGVLKNNLPRWMLATTR